MYTKIIGPARQAWKTVAQFYFENLAGDYRRADHELRKANRYYLKAIREAKKAHDYKKAEDLEAEWGGDVDGERAAFDLAETAYYLRRAQKYHIPTPDYKDGKYWEQDSYTHRYTLTVEGIDYVDNRFYEKRKKKWEFWLAFAAPATGLIGAIIGLVAIIVHATSK
jgi:hypothetical protein